MAKRIEIPDELHDRLARLARREGLSVDEYVDRELRTRLGRRPNADVLERLAKLPVVETEESAADIIRRLRDADDPRKAW